MKYYAKKELDIIIFCSIDSENVQDSFLMESTPIYKEEWIGKSWSGFFGVYGESNLENISEEKFEQLKAMYSKIDHLITELKSVSEQIKNFEL